MVGDGNFAVRCQRVLLWVKYSASPVAGGEIGFPVGGVCLSDCSGGREKIVLR